MAKPAYAPDALKPDETTVSQTAATELGTLSLDPLSARHSPARALQMRLQNIFAPPRIYSLMWTCISLFIVLSLATPWLMQVAPASGPHFTA